MNRYIFITRKGIRAYHVQGDPETLKFQMGEEMVSFRKARMSTGPLTNKVFYIEVEMSIYQAFGVLFDKATQFTLTEQELRKKEEDVKKLAGNTGVRMAFCFDDKSLPGNILVHQVQFHTLKLDGDLQDLPEDMEFVMIHPSNDARLDLLGHCSLGS